MLPEKLAQFNGRQKAAVLLVALGPEKSSQVYKHLGEEEIEELTLEIANVGKVPPEVKDGVIEEF
ncbi:MAG: flagellar motor switch protein FliG, partial [Armatimonadetes bacterium CG07_land_8_20_14_0_80_40_9]